MLVRCLFGAFLQFCTVLIVCSAASTASTASAASALVIPLGSIDVPVLPQRRRGEGGSANGTEGMGKWSRARIVCYDGNNRNTNINLEISAVLLCLLKNDLMDSDCMLIGNYLLIECIVFCK